ncbi:MAG: hypothetical protein ACODAQ_07960 [Phycisphaeraceae bacterium]
MPMVVYSPYSGRPVKVRDEDVNRAIRDEEGRIFYVVQRSDGQGHYTAPTRQGSEKDEQRYMEMISKSAAAEQQKHKSTPAAMHDATGPGRRGGMGRLVRLIILLVILLAVLYVALAYTGNLPAGIPNLLPVGGGQQPSSFEDELWIEFELAAVVQVAAFPNPLPPGEGAEQEAQHSLEVVNEAGEGITINRASSCAA